MSGPPVARDHRAVDEHALDTIERVRAASVKTMEFATQLMREVKTQIAVRASANVIAELEEFARRHEFAAQVIARGIPPHLKAQ